MKTPSQFVETLVARCKLFIEGPIPSVQLRAAAEAAGPAPSPIRMLDVSEKASLALVSAQGAETAAYLLETLRAMQAICYAMGAQPGVYSERFKRDLLEASGQLWNAPSDTPEVITALLVQFERGRQAWKERQ